MKTFLSPRAAFQIKVFRIVSLIFPLALFLLSTTKEVSSFNQKTIYERVDGSKADEESSTLSLCMCLRVIWFSGALKCKHDFSKLLSRHRFIIMMIAWFPLIFHSEEHAFNSAPKAMLRVKHRRRNPIADVHFVADQRKHFAVWQHAMWEMMKNDLSFRNSLRKCKMYGIKCNEKLKN